MRNLIYASLVISSLGLTVGCGGDDEVDSDEQARRAYLGLDDSIAKSITLGFAGFNAANSATIDPQTAAGTKAGTITVTGKVDQGSSANKGMRLDVGMVAYDDGDVPINEDGDTVHIVYDTSTDVLNQPHLDMQLKNIPTGTLDATLTSNTSMLGVYTLSGDIEGTLTLNLTIAGTLMAGATAGEVLRVPGTTTVTGTATNSDGGVYNIMLTI
jgi:hypothetical protein